MKELFDSILARLQEVTALKYIDLDKQQLTQDRPPVSFPCALIDIALPTCTDLDEFGHYQECRATITITLAFDFTHDTNSLIPDRTQSQSYFSTVEAVHQKLQGFTATSFNNLSRQSMREVVRADKYKVLQIVYNTDFRERT
jgi:hypothetical protein